MLCNSSNLIGQEQIYEAGLQNLLRQDPIHTVCNQPRQLSTVAPNASEFVEHSSRKSVSVRGLKVSQAWVVVLAIMGARLGCGAAVGVSGSAPEQGP